MDGSVLCVGVRDTGRAHAAPSAFDLHREGVGLRNLEQRLSRHYGDAASLRIECGARGTRVEVRVPAAAMLDEHRPAPAGERHL